MYKVGTENGEEFRRVSRMPISQSRACIFAAALRIGLLLSCAVCTHMSSAEERMGQADVTALKQLANARGRKRAESRQGTFRRLLSSDQSIRPALKSGIGPLNPNSGASYRDDGLHGDPFSTSGSPVEKHSEFSSRVQEREGITPADGHLRWLLDPASIHQASQDTNAESLREFDVKLEGVVGLGTAPPEGSLPNGSIAGWPIGAPGSARNRHTLGAQPKIVLLDMFGRKQNRFCPDYGTCVPVDHPVTASIHNNPGCGKLHGTTIVQSVNGVATFTDLMIDSFQSRYRMKFTAGLLISPVTSISPPFKVLQGQIYIPDDVLWNFDESGTAACRGCDDTAFCSMSSPITYNPPWTQATRMRVDAGALLRSNGAPGVRFQPCAGYEYPTVWVRKFNMHMQGIGSEYDGWEDVPNWDYNIEVRMQEPGCTFLDGEDDIMVCRRGLEAGGGSKSRKPDNFKANKGAPNPYSLEIFNRLCSAGTQMFARARTYTSVHTRK